MIGPVEEAPLTRIGYGRVAVTADLVHHLLVFDCLQVQRPAHWLTDTRQCRQWARRASIECSMSGWVLQSHQNQSFQQLRALSPNPMMMTVQAQTRTVACFVSACRYLRAVRAAVVQHSSSSYYPAGHLALRNTLQGLSLRCTLSLHIPVVRLRQASDLGSDLAVRIRFPARYAAHLRPRYQARKLPHVEWQSAGVMACAVTGSSARALTDLEAADAAVACSNATCAGAHAPAHVCASSAPLA